MNQILVETRARTVAIKRSVMMEYSIQIVTDLFLILIKYRFVTRVVIHVREKASLHRSHTTPPRVSETFSGPVVLLRLATSMKFRYEDLNPRLLVKLFLKITGWQLEDLGTCILVFPVGNPDQACGLWFHHITFIIFQGHIGFDPFPMKFSYE